MVGVAFVTGSFVLTDTLVASVNRLLSDATGQVDFVVRAVDGSGTSGGSGGGGGGGGGGGLDGGLRGLRGGLGTDLLPRLEAAPGVAKVDALVLGAAELLDKGGNAKAFDLSAVSNWPDHPAMSGIRLISGRGPTEPDEVVVDTTTASARNVTIGSTVRIATRRGVTEAKVVGLAQRGTGDLGAAGTILAFTLPRAIELIGTTDRIDSISIGLDDGTDRAAARATISAVAGPTATVTDADTMLAEARTRIQERLGNINSLMLGFAGVTLFVSAFLVWNTFSIVIAQRRRRSPSCAPSERADVRCSRRS